MRAGGLSGQLPIKGLRKLRAAVERRWAAACSTTPPPYFIRITILLCASNAGMAIIKQLPLGFLHSLCVSVNLPHTHMLSHTHAVAKHRLPSVFSYLDAQFSTWRDLCSTQSQLKCHRGVIQTQAAPPRPGAAPPRRVYRPGTPQHPL